MHALKLINGHHIYVETHGPAIGPPVVLLHHGLGAVRSWKGQMLVLAKAGLRVVAYDRWGHGKSDPRLTYAMPFFKEDLADLECLLNELGIPEATLIGHSDGGKIAMYFAAASPQRVTCLVIVAAHIYIETKSLSEKCHVKEDVSKGQLDKGHPVTGFLAPPSANTTPAD